MAPEGSTIGPPLDCLNGNIKINTQTKICIKCNKIDVCMLQILHDTSTTHVNMKQHVHTCMPKLQFSNTVFHILYLKLWPNTV